MGWPATSKVDALRNGEQAVREANEACELSGFRLPTFVDTRAAANAELGDFEKAVQYAEQACAKVGKLDKESIAMRQRLELFKQRKPYREEPTEENTTAVGTVGALQPLISQAQLAAARRIRGGEPGWTADGKRLIYALTGFCPEQSYLESLDLFTGETNVLCRGGSRPVCSPVDGSIAMERTDKSAVSSIWIVDKDGKNERVISENGYFPHWTVEGNLCFISKTADSVELVCLPISKSNQPIWSFNKAGVYILKLSTLEPVLLADVAAIARWSPDGKTYE